MKKTKLVFLINLVSLNIFAQSPGNVSSNLKLWLRADAGVTGMTPVTAWADQSSNANNATAGTGPDRGGR